jgi:flavoprotein
MIEIPILIEILWGLLRKGHDITVYIEEMGGVHRTLTEVEVETTISRLGKIVIFHYSLNNDQFTTSRHSCFLKNFEQRVTLEPGQDKMHWLLSIAKEPT